MTNNSFICIIFFNIFF